MRLEPLSTFSWHYETGGRMPAGYTIVQPYGSGEGLGYGEGRGSAVGRIEGSVVWSNYPRRRSDARMLPDVRGVVTAPDGATVLFELRGRTIFEHDVGRQTLVGWFETAHDDHLWLNDLVCVAEGLITAAGMVIEVYACVNELGVVDPG